MCYSEIETKRTAGRQNRSRYSWTAARLVRKVPKECRTWPAGRGANSWVRLSQEVPIRFRSVVINPVGRTVEIKFGWQVVNGSCGIFVLECKSAGAIIELPGRRYPVVIKN